MFPFTLRNVPVRLINSMATLPPECQGRCAAQMSEFYHYVLLLPLSQTAIFVAPKEGPTHLRGSFYFPRGERSLLQREGRASRSMFLLSLQCFSPGTLPVAPGRTHSSVKTPYRAPSPIKTSNLISVSLTNPKF